MWKQHFNYLLRKFPKITNKPTSKIINNQLDINQFTQEGLDVALRKLKTGKRPDLMKYNQKYGRQGNSMTYCSDTATPYVTRRH